MLQADAAAVRQRRGDARRLSGAVSHPYTPKDFGPRSR
jgi:hypothetical protein